MEEIYKKVYVKSAADLPKEDEVYYFGYYKENVVPFSVIYYDYDIRDVWLKSVDWYLQPVTAKTEQETKCNLCKDEHWIITHEGRVSEPCPACGGGKRYKEQEKPSEQPKRINYSNLGDDTVEVCNLLAKYSVDIENAEGLGDKGRIQYRHAKVIIEAVKKSMERPSEQSAEECTIEEEKMLILFAKHVNIFHNPSLRLPSIPCMNRSAFIAAIKEYASQKHPVTDDMISAKLDTVNFETSKERETAFDLLVWLRDLTGQKHLPIK